MRLFGNDSDSDDDNDDDDDDAKHGPNFLFSREPRLYKRVCPSVVVVVVVALPRYISKTAASSS